jgi:hypothetical protein
MKPEELIIVPLQTFAYDEDEDIELEDLNDEDDPDKADNDQDDPDSDDEDNEEDDADDKDGDDDDEDDDEDEDEGDEDDDADESSRDKKENAIIKYKRESKELAKENQQLREELDRQRNVNADKARAAKEKARKSELMDKEGYSEEAASAVAKAEAEAQELRDTASNRKFRELEKKYPGISNYREAITELRAKAPELSEEEIFMAKFYKDGEFDRKTQAEQEMLYRSRKAKDKSGVTQGNRKTAKVKLTPDDEAAYKILRKQNPSMTRKRFKKLSEED